MENKTGIKLAAQLSGNVKISVKAKKTLAALVLIVKKDGIVLFDDKYSLNSDGLSDEFCVENPRLWSISSPELYEYNARITYADGEKEDLSGKFGFRTLGQNGKNLLVNGKPVFVRGYIRGAKAHDHANLLGLPLKEFYLKKIRV